MSSDLEQGRPICVTQHPRLIHLGRQEGRDLAEMPRQSTLTTQQAHASARTTTDGAQVIVNPLDLGLEATNHGGSGTLDLMDVLEAQGEAAHVHAAAINSGT